MDFKQIGISLLIRILGNVAEQILELAIENAKNIAKDPSLATNSKKRSALIKKIKADAKTRGIKVKDSAINLLVEIAVSSIKLGE